MDPEDYYGDEDSYYIDDCDDEDEARDGFLQESDDDDDDDDGKTVTGRSAAAFSTLGKAEIERRQEELIADVSSFLSVPRAVAIALLVQFKWDSDVAQENWFSDEEKMRRSYGLTAAEGWEEEKLECKICFEIWSRKEVASLSCGHYFCRVCWSRYIQASIDDGAGCLTLRCPKPNCYVLVCQSTVGILAMDKQYVEKYARMLRRSYVEGKTGHKWCPAPDCETAVIFETGEKTNYDVVCDCSHEFCWNCCEDAHRPLDCATVEKWAQKNCSESDNVNWVLANTKPCPKCRLPIEKNQGCMHMTCRKPCRHEFCWLCLVDWSKHGDRTGGFYACNSYEKRKELGELDEAEAKRENAKRLLDQYAHYFERWAENRKARKRAAEDLEKMRAEQFPLLAYYRVTEAELNDTVSKAWKQVKECRRVLEWTYAYGYYLVTEADDGGGRRRRKGKRNLFEFLQGQAEASLERLHNCAEREILPFVEVAEAGGGKEGLVKAAELEAFLCYKVKLQQLTTTTANYFERLVSGLENGLEDVKPN